MIIVLHHQNCLTTCPNAHAVLYSNHNSVLLQCKVINTSGIQESVEYMYVFFYILVRAQFYHAMSHNSPCILNTLSTAYKSRMICCMQYNRKCIMLYTYITNRVIECNCVCGVCVLKCCISGL